MRPATRYASAGLLIVALAVGFQVWNHARAAAEERPEVGFTAPAFALTGLDGKEVKLADFRGKPVFLNFWATWCPPCREEMPFVQELLSAYGKDVAFLAVNLTASERGVKSVEEFMRQNGYTLPVALDKSGNVADKYLVRAIPTSFFIDAKGRIRQKVIGGMDKETMQGYLREILR